MTSALEQYRIVNAAWTEGRLENVLQRQKELALLHANIRKASSDLIRAISQGEYNTPEGGPTQFVPELTLSNRCANIRRERS